MTMSDNDQLLSGADGPDMAPVHQPSVMSRIRNYFLTGLIVAGPVAVTLWLIWSFVTWVDNWVRPFIPVELPPETYLPVNIPGFGLIIAFIALTLLGFLTANLVGRTLRRIRRKHAQPHADRAADLQDHEADFRDAVFQIGIELPHGRAGRVSGAGHVVAGVPVAGAERRHRRRVCRTARSRLGVHAVHAESDDRILLLRAAARRHRPRHHGRERHDAA